ncbi:cation-transporting P-type ATPase [Streptomyces sirii]|uniref:cation-transporting P-type ATPase n=1 Tax=Streptomyces sirii TaxID=3127701 RepID=UPI003D3635E9
MPDASRGRRRSVMPVRIRTRAPREKDTAPGAPTTGPAEVQQLSPAGLWEALKTSPGGLTVEEATRRRARWGRNEFPHSPAGACGARSPPSSPTSSPCCCSLRPQPPSSSTWWVAPRTPAPCNSPSRFCASWC